MVLNRRSVWAIVKLDSMEQLKLEFLNVCFIQTTCKCQYYMN